MNPLHTRTKHYYRGKRWHVWRRDGLRFGVGLIDQNRTIEQKKFIELIFWFGPFLATFKIKEY